MTVWARSHHPWGVCSGALYGQAVGSCLSHANAVAGTRLASMRGTIDYSLLVSSQPAVLQNNKMLVALAFIVVSERHCWPLCL